MTEEYFEGKRTEFKHLIDNLLDSLLRRIVFLWFIFSYIYWADRDMADEEQLLGDDEAYDNEALMNGQDDIDNGDILNGENGEPKVSHGLFIS